jgi:hypothetical protein
MRMPATHVSVAAGTLVGRSLYLLQWHFIWEGELVIAHQAPLLFRASRSPMWNTLKMSGSRETRALSWG